MSNPCHENQLARLRKVEGQIRGIQKMVEEGRYCIDILTQTKAIHAGLRAVEKNILRTHLTHCVQQSLSDTKAGPRDDKIVEIIKLFDC